MTYEIEIKLADVVGPTLKDLTGKTQAAVDTVINSVLCHRETIDVVRLLAEHRAIAQIWDADMLLSHYPHLTREQAWEVLQACDRTYRAEIGLTWADVDEVVDELHPDTVDLDLNSKRVARCADALQSYSDSDAKLNLVDLLTDTRHWCDQNAESFGELDRTAYQHYLAERNGKE